MSLPHEEPAAPDGRIAAIRQPTASEIIQRLRRMSKPSLILDLALDQELVRIELEQLLDQLAALTGTVARLQQEKAELLARSDTRGDSITSSPPHRNEG